LTILLEFLKFIKGQPCQRGFQHGSIWTMWMRASNRTSSQKVLPLVQRIVRTPNNEQLTWPLNTSMLERWLGLSAEVGRVAQEAGVPPPKVLVVSKGRPLKDVNDLISSGVSTLGEHRPEGLAQRAETFFSKVEHHYIGPFQSRHLRTIASCADVVHSFHRPDLARKWANTEPKAWVMLQVNAGDDKTKHGVHPNEVGGALATLFGERIDVRGLMTMAPRTDNPETSRPVFERLAALRQKHVQKYPQLKHLSMGTTQDWRVAVSCGATWIRVGRELFEPESNKEVIA